MNSDSHCRVCDIKLFDVEQQKQIWPEVRVVENDPNSAVCMCCAKTITENFIKIHKIKKPSYENN